MKKIVYTLLSLLLMISLFSCSHMNEYTNFIRLDNGDYIDFIIYDYNLDLDNITKEITNICINNNKLLDEDNEYDGLSNIATLNKKRVATLDNDIVELLKYSDKIMSRFDNSSLVDKQLSDLFIEAYNNNQLPNDETISSVVDAIKNTTLSFNNNEVSIVGNGSVHINYLIKGYVLSKVKQLFESKKIDKYVVNYNGESLIYGKNKDGQGVKSALYGIPNGNYEFKDTAVSKIDMMKHHASGYSSVKIYSDIVSLDINSISNILDVLFVQSEDIILNSLLTYALFNLPLEEIKNNEHTYKVNVLAYKDKSFVYRSSELVDKLIK